MHSLRQYRSVPWSACRQLLLWLLLAGGAGPALALSLGQETVLSALGDPVEVEIEVLQWEDVELQRIQIALAGAAEYDSFKLTRLPVLQQLDFNLVGPNTRGELKILVSTREPVAEPFLELLLVLRWPGGSLLREYVLLFDLPGVALTVNPVPVEVEPVEDSRMPQPAPEAPPPVVEPAVAGPEEQSATAPRNQGAIVVDSVVPPAAPPPSGRRLYEVQEGDGLWSIAQQFQPAGAADDLYQMLLSLHDLNRAAFINGNISLLKAGALLQIPDATDIAAVDAATARSRFEQRWDEGTQALQTAVRGEPVSAPGGESDAGAVDTPDGAGGLRISGEESGRVPIANGGGLLLPAETTAVVPRTNGTESTAGLVLGEATQGAAIPTAAPDVALVVPPAAASADLARVAAAPPPVEPTLNPWRERVDGTARDLQQLLHNRQLQIARLEQQIVEMQQRMRDAREVTAQLNQALELELARQAGTRSMRGAVTALGALSLVLIVALLAAMVMLLKVTTQLRSRQRMTAEVGHSSREMQQLQTVAQTGRAPTKESASVFGSAATDGIVVEEELPGFSAAGAEAALREELLELIGPQTSDTMAGKSGV